MVMLPAVGERETHHDAHGGRLASTVGTEEAGHLSGLAGKADIVDGGECAVLLRESFNCDHATRLPGSSGPGIRLQARSRVTKVGGHPSTRDGCVGLRQHLILGYGPTGDRAVPACAEPVGAHLAVHRHARSSASAPSRPSASELWADYRWLVLVDLGVGLFALSSLVHLRRRWPRADRRTAPALRASSRPVRRGPPCWPRSPWPPAAAGSRSIGIGLFGSVDVRSLRGRVSRGQPDSPWWIDVTSTHVLS